VPSVKSVVSTAGSRFLASGNCRRWHLPRWSGSTPIRSERVGVNALHLRDRRFSAAWAGFTLTEVLVAIGIVATLAGLAFGGGRHALGNARVARARAELAVIAVALDAHRARHGADPRAADPVELLAALAESGRGRTGLDCGRLTVVHADTGQPSDPRHEPRAVLADPWGRPYVYSPPDPARGIGRGRLFSAGPDGDPATEGDNVRAE
jgi:general secretion pathway protein G